MQDAQHLRDQAALCLEIARQMSDRQAVENLRTSAAHYFAKATVNSMLREKLCRRALCAQKTFNRPGKGELTIACSGTS